MTNEQDLLAEAPVFGGLDADGVAAVRGQMTEVRWEAGETVFATGEPGDAMFVIVDGAVELFAMAGDMERLYSTARAGGALGLLELLDAGPRPGTARAAEATRALRLERSGLEALAAERPAVVAGLLRGIGAVTARGARQLAEQYTAALAWNLEVTNLTSLNLDRLLSDSVRVVIDRSRGEPVVGRLFRLEQSRAGHELYVEADGGDVVIVPYHAIVSVRVDRGDVPPPDDAPVGG